MRDRILAVEDSPTQALRLKAELEEAGFEVVVAASGEEALAAAGTDPPGVVVTDIVMPGMDGWELTRRLRKVAALEHVPVILLTQLSSPEDIILGIECGASSFIVKPYDSEFLVDQVRFHLVNAKRRRHIHSDVEIEIEIRGKMYRFTTDRLQLLDLLFSTYDNLVARSRQLEEKNAELERAMTETRILQGLIPICMGCKKIRNDRGYWEQLERYISEHSEAEFSHCLCPECRERLYPGVTGGP